MFIILPVLVIFPLALISVVEWILPNDPVPSDVTLPVFIIFPLALIIPEAVILFLAIRLYPVILFPVEMLEVALPLIFPLAVRCLSNKEPAPLAPILKLPTAALLSVNCSFPM